MDRRGGDQLSAERPSASPATAAAPAAAAGAGADPLSERALLPPCRDNAARLYGALAESSWRDHAKVVLMTAQGLAAPGFARDVMQPLSGLAVETWAEFSSRQPSMPVRCAGFGRNSGGREGSGCPLVCRYPGHRARWHPEARGGMACD